MKRITTFLFAFLITASLTLAAQEPATKDQTSGDKKVQKAEKKEASAADPLPCWRLLSARPKTARAWLPS
jgi:hypothetical protein